MKVIQDPIFAPITITIETAQEREALIEILDRDRNHPARRQLYDALRASRLSGVAASDVVTRRVADDD